MANEERKRASRWAIVDCVMEMVPEIGYFLLVCGYFCWPADDKILSCRTLRDGHPVNSMFVIAFKSSATKKIEPLLVFGALFRV